MNDLDVTESLPVLIDRAATTLASAKTSGEVLEARDMASVAYDAAKSAARIARAKGAHDEILSAVYRAQGEAALVEARAKSRLADEYDAAQERGEVASASSNRGNQWTVPDGNEAPTAADIGLTRKDIHEARQIRDAEMESPGIVEKTINEALESGKPPTKAKIKAATKRKIVVAPPSQSQRKKAAKVAKAIIAIAESGLAGLEVIRDIPPEVDTKLSAVIGRAWSVVNQIHEEYRDA